MSSILKVDEIQDTSGNNIINENANTITIGKAGNTTNIVGTLQNDGAALISGITEADQWRITANHSGVGDVTANWERNDSTGFNYIGTGMTESSGIFTFPSTGIYFIKFNTMNRITLGDTTYMAARILVTPDNFNYTEVSANYVSLLNGAYGNAECNYIFDVTNTSTHKVKFRLAQNQNGTPVFQGYTDQNQTYATFIRLGDT